MAVPVFTQVVYLSPWLPLPPGWSKVGVDAVVSPPAGSGLILAGRLRQGATSLQVGVGASATEVVLVPAAPLSATLDYYVDVQWVASGTQPGSVVWTDPSVIATSPVVTAVVTLDQGSIAGTLLSLAWDFGAAALTPAGANLSVFNTSGKSAGFARVQGVTGAVTLTTSATAGSQLYLQAVMPVSGVPGAGFNAPFSMGPIVSGAPLPVTAPTMTSVAFDGGTVQAAWTPPTAPATGGSVGYDLVASAGGAGSATTAFPASSAGGVAVLGTPGAAGWSAAGRVRIGPIVGAAGTPVALLTQTPTLDQITVDAGGAGVSVRATFPAGTPAGATATVELVKGGAVIASGSVSASGGTADITAAGVSGDGWQVRGRLLLTSGGASLTGPTSASSAVLADAPIVRDIQMTPDPAGGGWIVTVEAAAPPAGASLSVTLTQGSTTVATQPITSGTSTSFTLTQGTAGTGQIDGATVATASLTLVSASATSPAGQATFVGAAPTLTAIQNIGAGDPTGQPQGLQVDAAAGGQAGQVLALQLSAGGQVVATSLGATATHANLPLTQALDPSLDWRIQARWSGAGVVASTFGGWTAPVSVLTATGTVLNADYDNGQLALSVQAPQGVAPAQGSYLFAGKTGGGSLTGASVVGTRGSFALAAGSDTWQAGVKPFQTLSSGASNRSLAPSSALVPLLTTAPTLAALSYDGAVLQASWNIVSDAAGNAATGAMMQVSDGTGSVLTAAAGSSSGEISVRLLAAAQGQAKLKVRAVRAASTGDFLGPYCAEVAPILSAPAIGAVTLTDTDVVAVITPLPSAPAGTTYRGWLYAGDQAVVGPVTAVTASGVTTLTLAYAAAGVSGLSVVVQAQAGSATPTLQGPLSAPAPVLSVAPVITSVLIAPSATSGKWRLDAAWQAPADGAAISGYTLTLIKVSDSSVVATAPFGATGSGSLTFNTSGLSASEAYSLTLTAASDAGSTTPAASTPVWFATSAFTAAAVSASQISGQWTAVSGPTGVVYRLDLVDTASAQVLASTSTAATSAALDVASLSLDPAGAYALNLGFQLGPVLFLPGANGAANTRPALFMGRPTGLAVTTAPATGIATLNWPAVAGAQAYVVTFSDGRAAQAPTTNSYAFPAALAAGTDLNVTVSANVTTNGVVCSGPPSAALAMPTTAPALDWADYDGANVTASWQPVAGASGYVATVLDSSNAVAAQSPQSPDTSVVIASALTAADGPFTVVVQAVTEAGSGLASVGLPVFQTAWFLSTAQPSVQPPNIYPSSTLALTPEDISIYLPPLANSTITVAAVGAFDLQANTDAGTKDALPYILSFASDSEAWSFTDGSDPAPPIRPQLQADYIAFLQAAETAGASSWGISVLQQAISRWMPQTFQESHYYAYGLNLTGGSGTGSIDLRQGLVLRVGFADYTNVWSGDENSWLNGFGGGSPSDFDVADGMSGAGSWQLSMDAFTAMLTGSGVMSVSPPSTIVAAAKAAGVADAADLFFAGFPNPFYRLFFPGQLESPTGTGSVTPSANFALASAASYTALSGSSSTPSNSAPVAYFRGRAVLRLMIRVSVNDVEVVVPLGTTVGNILDRYCVRPPATPIQLTGVTLERAGGPGLAVFGASPAPPSLTYDSATRRLVRLDWATMPTYGGPADATNLPLLHGDRIAF